MRFYVASIVLTRDRKLSSIGQEKDASSYHPCLTQGRHIRLSNYLILGFSTFSFRELRVFRCSEETLLYSLGVTAIFDDAYQELKKSVDALSTEHCARVFSRNMAVIAALLLEALSLVHAISCFVQCYRSIDKMMRIAIIRLVF